MPNILNNHGDDPPQTPQSKFGFGRHPVSHLPLGYNISIGSPCSIPNQYQPHIASYTNTYYPPNSFDPLFLPTNVFKSQPLPMNNNDNIPRMQPNFSFNNEMDSDEILQCPIFPIPEVFTTTEYFIPFVKTTSPMLSPTSYAITCQFQQSHEQDGNIINTEQYNPQQPILDPTIIPPAILHDTFHQDTIHNTNPINLNDVETDSQPESYVITIQPESIHQPSTVTSIFSRPTSGQFTTTSGSSSTKASSGSSTSATNSFGSSNEEKLSPTNKGVQKGLPKFPHLNTPRQPSDHHPKPNLPIISIPQQSKQIAILHSYDFLSRPTTSHTTATPPMSKHHVPKLSNPNSSQQLSNDQPSLAHSDTSPSSAPSHVRTLIIPPEYTNSNEEPLSTSSISNLVPNVDLIPAHQQQPQCYHYSHHGLQLPPPYPPNTVLHDQQSNESTVGNVSTTSQSGNQSSSMSLSQQQLPLSSDSISASLSLPISQSSDINELPQQSQLRTNPYTHDNTSSTEQQKPQIRHEQQLSGSTFASAPLPTSSSSTTFSSSSSTSILSAPSSTPASSTTFQEQQQQQQIEQPPPPVRTHKMNHYLHPSSTDFLYFDVDDLHTPMPYEQTLQYPIKTTITTTPIPTSSSIHSNQIPTTTNPGRSLTCIRGDTELSVLCQSNFRFVTNPISGTISFQLYTPPITPSSSSTISQSTVVAPEFSNLSIVSLPPSSSLIPSSIGSEEQQQQQQQCIPLATPSNMNPHFYHQPNPHPYFKPQPHHQQSRHQPSYNLPRNINSPTNFSIQSKPPPRSSTISNTLSSIQHSNTEILSNPPTFTASKLHSFLRLDEDDQVEVDNDPTLSMDVSDRIRWKNQITAARKVSPSHLVSQFQPFDFYAPFATKLSNVFSTFPLLSNIIQNGHKSSQQIDYNQTYSAQYKQQEKSNLILNNLSMQQLPQLIIDSLPPKTICKSIYSAFNQETTFLLVSSHNNERRLHFLGMASTRHYHRHVSAQIKCLRFHLEQICTFYHQPFLPAKPVLPRPGRHSSSIPPTMNKPRSFFDLQNPPHHQPQSQLHSRQINNSTGYQQHLNQPQYCQLDPQPTPSNTTLTSQTTTFDIPVLPSPSFLKYSSPINDPNSSSVAYQPIYSVSPTNITTTTTTTTSHLSTPNTPRNFIPSHSTFLPHLSKINNNYYDEIVTNTNNNEYNLTPYDQYNQSLFPLSSTPNILEFLSNSTPFFNPTSYSFRDISIDNPIFGLQHLSSCSSWKSGQKQHFNDKHSSSSSSSSSDSSDTLLTYPSSTNTLLHSESTHCHDIHVKTESLSNPSSLQQQQHQDPTTSIHIPIIRSENSSPPEINIDIINNSNNNENENQTQNDVILPYHHLNLFSAQILQNKHIDLQDGLVIHTTADHVAFILFDGHGEYGSECASLAASTFTHELSKLEHLHGQVSQLYHHKQQCEYNKRNDIHDEQLICCLCAYSDTLPQTVTANNNTIPHPSMSSSSISASTSSSNSSAASTFSSSASSSSFSTSSSSKDEDEYSHHTINNDFELPPSSSSAVNQPHRQEIQQEQEQQQKSNQHQKPHFLTLQQFMIKTFAKAHKSITQFTESKGGTTCVVSYLCKRSKKLHTFWVGDSRSFILHPTRFTPSTTPTTSLPSTLFSKLDITPPPPTTTTTTLQLETTDNICNQCHDDHDNDQSNNQLSTLRQCSSDTNNTNNTNQTTTTIDPSLQSPPLPPNAATSPSPPYVVTHLKPYKQLYDHIPLTIDHNLNNPNESRRLQNAPMSLRSRKSKKSSSKQNKLDKLRLRSNPNPNVTNDHQTDDDNDDQLISRKVINSGNNNINNNHEMNLYENSLLPSQQHHQFKQHHLSPQYHSRLREDYLIGGELAISRALGHLRLNEIGLLFEPEYSCYAIQPGDLLFLCSDGCVNAFDHFPPTLPPPSINNTSTSDSTISHVQSSTATTATTSTKDISNTTSSSSSSSSTSTTTTATITTPASLDQSHPHLPIMLNDYHQDFNHNINNINQQDEIASNLPHLPSTNFEPPFPQPSLDLCYHLEHDDDYSKSGTPTTKPVFSTFSNSSLATQLSTPSLLVRLSPACISSYSDSSSHLISYEAPIIRLGEIERNTPFSSHFQTLLLPNICGCNLFEPPQTSVNQTSTTSPQFPINTLTSPHHHHQQHHQHQPHEYYKPSINKSIPIPYHPDSSHPHRHSDQLINFNSNTTKTATATNDVVPTTSSTSSYSIQDQHQFPYINPSPLPTTQPFSHPFPLHNKQQHLPQQHIQHDSSSKFLESFHESISNPDITTGQQHRDNIHHHDVNIQHKLSLDHNENTSHTSKLPALPPKHSSSPTLSSSSSSSSQSFPGYNISRRSLTSSTTASTPSPSTNTSTVVQANVIIGSKTTPLLFEHLQSQTSQPHSSPVSPPHSLSHSHKSIYHQHQPFQQQSQHQQEHQQQQRPLSSFMPSRSNNPNQQNVVQLPQQPLMNEPIFVPQSQQQQRIFSQDQFPPDNIANIIPTLKDLDLDDDEYGSSKSHINPINPKPRCISCTVLRVAQFSANYTDDNVTTLLVDLDQYFP